MENIPQPEKKYPYVVRRVMATVYQRIEVVFTTEKCHPPPGGLHIVMNHRPYDDHGNPTPEARNALVEVLLVMTRTSGFRMCAVFADQDATYVEPDGQVNQSTGPPSGGINL